MTHRADDGDPFTAGWNAGVDAERERCARIDRSGEDSPQDYDDAFHRLLDEVETLKAENARLREDLVTVQAKLAFGKNELIAARDKTSLAIEYVIDAETAAHRNREQENP